MSDTKNTSKKSNKADDLFAKITNKLIEEIESIDPTKPNSWKVPWSVLGHGTAINTDGRPYRGLNTLILAFAAEEAGYDSGVWGTYKAWAAKKGQVRKGEKGTQVVLWKPFEKTDPETGEKKKTLFATTFTVFAAEQVEGSEKIVAKYRSTTERDSVEAIADAEAYFEAIKDLEIIRGGDRAYYTVGTNTVHVPKLDQFEEAPAFYATLAHEAGHWTGHKDRLDREFGKRFGTEAYAFEELVAELTSAFWCGQSGISTTPRPDHAQYLASWLKVLKNDHKAIVTAASKAQAALDFLDKAALGNEAEITVEAAA